MSVCSGFQGLGGGGGGEEGVLLRVFRVVRGLGFAWV